MRRRAGPPPCAHCHGSGHCAQVCCTVFGYQVVVQGHRGQVLVPACAACRGTGQAGAR